VKRSRINQGVKDKSATPPPNVRAIMRAAFVHSISATGISHAAVARLVGKNGSTIRRWLAQTTLVDVEALEQTRLWPHFFRCWVALERKARRI
jgi:hypothetical protein